MFDLSVSNFPLPLELDVVIELPNGCATVRTCRSSLAEPPVSNTQPPLYEVSCADNIVAQTSRGAHEFV